MTTATKTTTKTMTTTATVYAVVDDAGTPWGIGRTEHIAWADSVEWLDEHGSAHRIVTAALCEGRNPTLDEQDTARVWARETSQEEISEWQRRGFSVGVAD